MIGYNYYNSDESRVDIVSKRLYSSLKQLNNLIKTKLPQGALSIGGEVMNHVDLMTYNRVWNDPLATSGGRLYNQLTSMSKEVRSTFRFDNEPVIELDLQCAAPRMLYHLAGIDEQRDIYSVGIDPRERAFYKLGMNIMLNCDIGSASYALLSHVGSMDKAKRIVRDISNIHNPISKYMYVKSGLKLQVLESDIAIGVLTELYRQGITTTGIHDAFLVPESKVDIAKELICDHYKKILNTSFNPVIKVKTLEDSS
jgi:hypothetical protein